jgi:hypothetical protein
MMDAEPIGDPVRGIQNIERARCIVWMSEILQNSIET